MDFKRLARRALRGSRRRTVMLRSRFSRRPILPPPNRALKWLRDHCLPEASAGRQTGEPDAWPGLAGCLVPTLLAYGEKDLAVELVRRLVSVQREDGGFAGSAEPRSLVFDTGNALRGLLAVGELAPQATVAARRAADYLLDRMIDGGQRGFAGRDTAGTRPETARLYVLPALFDAAQRLSQPRYAEAARRCADHYTGRPDPAGLGGPIRFLASELEALLELGRRDLAEPVLDQLRGLQRSDGSVRKPHAARSVSVAGLAHLTLCWYRLGWWEPADRAMAWLDVHQRPGGGFRVKEGSLSARWSPVDAGWAAKFYLDAHGRRVRQFFGRHADQFPGEVPLDDGRVRVIAESVRPGDRVVEVGCGKGRFLKAVLARQPDARCTGVDPSEGLSRYLPPEVESVAGTLESIPLPDDAFDVAFSVEAVQHSANPERAVEELIRIVRPGGRVIIIDKQRAQWGRLDCPPWEHWPQIDWLTDRLRPGCDQLSAQPVPHDNHPADGLFVAWQARKSP